ncbi:MBL fold metallo-hydrolase [Serratia marcescens]|uniref:MBL fold metallo-hydrolase n=1 Tax=Serratia marcescens TaxID=615 RepID=UPI0035173B52
MIHVHQSFNAVGHGTFFNGLAIDGKSNCAFSWIYDCGSKRTTRIEQELSFLEAWGKWPKEIDLLVLSHFDNDHVNGVERLLRSRRVRTLALPYMDVGQSLAYAASIGTDPCSISTATFQLNPIDWLQARGLAGQVDTLLLVQGGPHDNNDIPFEGEPVPLIGGPESNQIKRDSRIDTDATTTFPGVSATIFLLETLLLSLAWPFGSTLLQLLHMAFPLRLCFLTQHSRPFSAKMQMVIYLLVDLVKQLQSFKPTLTSS